MTAEEVAHFKFVKTALETKTPILTSQITKILIVLIRDMLDRAVEGQVE